MSIRGNQVFTLFEKITDPRSGNATRHDLQELLIIALCSVLGGADTWADVERFALSKQAWFESFLELEHGIPSHDTFGRVFALLDTAEFLECLTTWVVSLQAAAGRQVAIDGKVLCGSYDTAAGQSPLHLVSAWASDFHLTLGQLAVDHKSNEIPAVRELVKLLDLKGAVVTIDALHCQKETAQAIRDRDADYVLQLKGNQAALHNQVQDLFIAAGDRGYRGVSKHVTVDKQPSRRERREYYALPAPAAIQKAWPGAQSVVMVYRERKRGAQESTETSFALSSLPPDAKTLGTYLRNHWRIENSLHWSLDVTFSEDQSRIRKGAGPEVAGFLRRFVLSILKQDKTLKDALRGKRLRAGWSEKTLEQLLLGISRGLKCD